jgi:hypothetical protein
VQKVDKTVRLACYLRRSIVGLALVLSSVLESVMRDSAGQPTTGLLGGSAI